MRSLCTALGFAAAFATSMAAMHPEQSGYSHPYYATCYNWLWTTYGGHAAAWYRTLVGSGGEPVGMCGIAAEAAADYAGLRQVESQLGAPQVLANTFWSLRTGNYGQMRASDRGYSIAEAYRTWRAAIVNQQMGPGPTAIFTAFTPPGAGEAHSRDIYYKTFAYSNGFEAGYIYGGYMHRHLRAKGRQDDAMGASILNTARQYANNVLQATPWSHPFSGAFWQGFADGYNAGLAEGGQAARKPGPADFNRAAPAECRNRDRTTPNYDDLHCREINYGPGMLRR